MPQCNSSSNGYANNFRSTLILRTGFRKHPRFTLVLSGSEMATLLRGDYDRQTRDETTNGRFSVVSARRESGTPDTGTVRTHRRIEGVLETASWSTRWLSVVRFRSGRKVRFLCICAWRQNLADYRRLRCRLKHPMALDPIEQNPAAR